MRKKMSHHVTWHRDKAPAMSAKKDECDARFAQSGAPGEFTRWIVQIAEAALTAAQTPNHETGKVEIDSEVFANLKGWGKR